MDNQHKMISGYRDLSREDIELVNAIKAMEMNLAGMWLTVMEREGTDKRWAAIARTHFEEGCSALVRSVTRPESMF